MTMAGTWNCSDSVLVRLHLDICYRMRSSREVAILLLNQPIESYIHTYIHDHSPRGFSGPVQLNGIGRMHEKAPLAAAKRS